MKEIKIENDMLIVGGRGVRLTKEQLEHLGFKENIFHLGYEDEYFCINRYGNIFNRFNRNEKEDKFYWEVGNACKDKEVMKQRALYETLSRLLWRFSLENGGDEIDWRKLSQEKWFIYYDPFWNKFKPDSSNKFKTNKPDSSNKFKTNATFFISEKVTQRAINEVIKPFMEENPEFRW